MMPTDQILDYREAFWLFRYKGGDAFAISDLPEECRWTEMDDICQVQQWSAPEAFRKMIDAGDKVIMWYHVHRINRVEFETLREFGIPVIDTINEKGMPVLPHGTQ